MKDRKGKTMVSPVDNLSLKDAVSAPMAAAHVLADWLSKTGLMYDERLLALHHAKEILTKPSRRVTVSDFIQSSGVPSHPLCQYRRDSDPPGVYCIRGRGKRRGNG